MTLGNATAGSLRGLTTLGEWEMWVCVQGHACAGVRDSMCFVYDEVETVFYPWSVRAGPARILFRVSVVLTCMSVW